MSELVTKDQAAEWLKRGYLSPYGDNLLATRQALVEALRPLAALWITEYEKEPDDLRILDFVWGKHFLLTVGDIRRARELLAALHEEVSNGG